MMQYFVPGNGFFVGDCMPFFHDGRFHLYYLLDEGHHQAKGGLGGHQWAHSSTTDLVHWQHHPLAIPCTEEWEGSICTGSTLFHEGTYYGFYATRLPDRTQHLSLAVSSDGINFTKTQPNPFASPPPGYNPRHYRDPKVFREEQTGLFHMIVTAELENYPVAGRGGCLAHLVSNDLRSWELKDPFILPGFTQTPECPDYFYWRGWYYLIFTNHWQAVYRMSRQPFGPWLRPRVDVFDCPQAVVMKTAAFTGDRRIGVAFLASGPEGSLQGTVGAYGGNAIFREIIQNEDGTLGTTFPAQMIPVSGDALTLPLTALAGDSTSDGHKVSLSAPEGMAAVMLSNAPRNVRITAQVKSAPGTASFGIVVRGTGQYQQGHELRCEPYRQKVGWHHPDSRFWEQDERAAIYDVEGLDRPFSLDIIVKDDILDVCVDGRRTLVNRAALLDGDEIVFFC